MHSLTVIQKLISWNPTQSLNAELAKLTGELSTAESKKKNNTGQVEEIEQEIRQLGKEVIEKVGLWFLQTMMSNGGHCILCKRSDSEPCVYKRYP